MLTIVRSGTFIWEAVQSELWVDEVAVADDADSEAAGVFEGERRADSARRLTEAGAAAAAGQLLGLRDLPIAASGATADEGPGAAALDATSARLRLRRWRRVPTSSYSRCSPFAVARPNDRHSAAGGLTDLHVLGYLFAVVLPKAVFSTLLRVKGVLEVVEGFVGRQTLGFDKHLLRHGGVVHAHDAGG